MFCVSSLCLSWSYSHTLSKGCHFIPTQSLLKRYYCTAWQVTTVLLDSTLFEGRVSIEKNGSDFLSRDWVGSKWHHVCMGAAPRQTQQSDGKHLYMKTLSYSKVKYTPRVPLILHTLKKLHMKMSISFFLFLLLSFIIFFFSSFSLTYSSSKSTWHIWMICTQNDCSTTRDYSFLG